MDLKRYLPTPDQLRGYRSLRFLGNLIFQHDLWHFNARSVSYGALVGGFFCYMPMPLQTIPALLLCIWIRCNVPVAAIIVWITNPITMPPMLIFAYHVGNFLLGRESALQMQHLGCLWDWSNCDWDNFAMAMGSIWQPLLLGCLVCGTVVGLACFAVVRVYYRLRIFRYLQARRQRRRERRQQPPGDG